MKKSSCIEDARTSTGQKALIPGVLVALALITGFTQSKAQVPDMKNLERMSNDISPGNIWIKYICNFPVSRTEVMLADNGQRLEFPLYDNKAFLEPVMVHVLDGSVTVFDPNYWGDVYDLGKDPLPGKIDTSMILKYMGAGADTNILVDESGNITLLPVYIKPDLAEISGIFFMESWLMNIDRALFHKEVLAWLPIRDYYTATDHDPVPVKQRRLLFMASPFIAQKLGGKQASDDYRLIYSDRASEINLYNRPYAEYLYREDSGKGISRQDYEEWEYHQFDFYKFFNRKIFLDVLLSAVIDGRLPAFDAENGQKLGSKKRSELKSIDTEEINSMVFHEDWYLDPVSLSVVKAVRSLVLMRHIRDFDDYTGEYIRTRKIPLVEIRLNPG